MAADLVVELKFGALSAIMSAEGQSWNPDVADDMNRRVMDAMVGLVVLCKTAGVLHLIPLLPDIGIDDEEDADT